MRFFLLSLFFFLIIDASAQEGGAIEVESPTPVTEDKDSLRRYYIKDFPEYFFLYPVLKQRGLNFELAKTDRSALLTYKPNNTYSLGLGAYIFEVGVELAFAIPLQERSIEKFGESKARDLQLNVLTKRWGLDAFYQRYRGFYIIDRENPTLPGDPLPQRPDIGIRNFGITGHYVFNPRQFSFRSAYNFSERQLYSKGSFVLFATLYTFRAAGDSSIVKYNRQVDFGSHVGFERLRYTTFSIAPGYTYNLTYNNFFLNATLALGPAHHWVNYDLERNATTDFDVAINSFIGARVAVGYNGYRIFGGVSFISQGSRLRFETVNFSNNNNSFKVLVGYRFQEVGILQKRFWDFVPFL